MSGSADNHPLDNDDLNNASKLAILPAWLQNGLPTLTRIQLKTFGAVISK